MWADWGAMSAREWRSTETFGQPVQRFWNERSSFLGKLQQDRQRWKSRKRKDARALRQKAPAGTRRAKGGAVHFMKSSRGTLIFMLLAVLGVDHAAAASPAFDARKTRLAEIAVHCFVPRTDGVILERRYRLDAFGGLTFVRNTNASAAVTIPAEEFDKVLLSGAAWEAYRLLGPLALVSFELTKSTRPPMPAFRFSEEDARAVPAYLRSLGKK